MTSRKKRMAVPVLVLALACLLGAPPHAASAQSSSDEGAPFLLLPVGADAVALGRAVTARPGQESAFWNPAGLASVEGSRFVVLRGDDGLGLSTAASALLVRPGVGTLGVSYLLIDLGGQELRDSQDNELGAFSVRSHLTVMSAAARLIPGLDVGVNFKLARFRLSCRGACGGVQTGSTAYAIDAGAQFVPGARGPLRLGAMVANLGPAFQLENASQADPLPARIRVGASYDALARLDRPGLEGWLTVEVQERLRRFEDPSIYFGSELVAGRGDAFFVRAGYAIDADQGGGMSVGFGLRFQKFEVSVAKAPAGSIAPTTTEPYGVSFSVVF